MKNLGIWIDTRTAYLVSSDETSSIVEISSNVEEVNEKGGYGSANKQLPQDAISPTKLAERKKQQLNAFFENIIKQLGNTGQLYIMGPGETRKLFGKAIETNSSVKFKVVGNEPADSISQNQLREKVRNYFNDKKQ